MAPFAYAVCEGELAEPEYLDHDRGKGGTAAAKQ
jgi:hypothetical protein